MLHVLAHPAGGDGDGGGGAVHGGDGDGGGGDAGHELQPRHRLHLHWYA